MDKIAIISDIHGNLEALKSVLSDIEKRDIKTIYCLGDIIAKGVHSKECLKLVREKCDVIVRGNCDEFFSSPIDIEKYDGISKERIKWNKEKLSDEEQQFLLNLPFCHEFYMSGSLIRLFHATPTKINDFVGDIDSLEKKRDLFKPTPNTVSQNIADVVIYGHIHTQYLGRLYNKTIVNAGSVGNPIDVIRNDNFDGKTIETTRANYVIIKGHYGSKTYEESLSFELVRVPYDIEKELNSPEKNIEEEAYRIELQEGKYRDMAKIEASFKARNIDSSKF